MKTQRTIKFRAWDGKQMIHLDGQHWCDEYAYLAFSCKESPGICGLSEIEFDEDKAVVMQFIGLLDDNGKEIYEGDCLKISMQGDIQNSPFVVENMWDLRIGIENNDPYMRIDSELEIIGNIYENPELLTEK